MRSGDQQTAGNDDRHAERWKILVLGEAPRSQNAQSESQHAQSSTRAVFAIAQTQAAYSKQSGYADKPPLDSVIGQKTQAKIRQKSDEKRQQRAVSRARN